MGYTVHDWFDDNLTGPKIVEAMGKVRRRSDSIELDHLEALFEALNITQYLFGYNQSYNLGRLLSEVTRELGDLEGLRDIPDKFRLLFNLLEPDKHLFSLRYKLGVGTSIKNTYSKKIKKFNFLKSLKNLIFLKFKSKAIDFNLLDLLERINKNRLESKDEDPYLSSFDIFQDYIESLNNKDFMISLTRKLLDLKFEEESAYYLPEKLDSVFGVLCEEYFLLKVVYMSEHGICEIDYPDLSGE